MGALGVFAVLEEHLFEPLAWSQSCEDELDLVWVVSGKADHVLRKIDDEHRLAHVEDVDGPVFPEGAGLVAPIARPRGSS